MKHQHKPKTSVTRGYGGAVKHPENRAAHGNVCVVDTCRCGAERKTNVNGRHIERGPWKEEE